MAALPLPSHALAEETAEARVRKQTLDALERLPHTNYINVCDPYTRSELSKLVHHPCVLCGMVPVAAKLFSRKLLYQALQHQADYTPELQVSLPNEDPDSTWSPVSLSSIDKFHHSLMVIHAYTSVPQGSPTWRESPFAGPPLGLLFAVIGVKPNAQQSGPLSYASALKIVTDDDLNNSTADDLRTCKATTSLASSISSRHAIYPSSYNFHGDCFEFLQAVAKEKLHGTISLSDLWQRNKYYKDTEKITEGEYGALYYYPLLEFLCDVNEDFYGKKNTVSDDFDGYFNETLKSGNVDKDVKFKYWRQEKVEVFHPIDDFPVEITASEDDVAKNKKREEISDASGLATTPFDRFPSEILEKILAYTDVKTTLLFRLTCKRLQEAVLPLMDCIAFHDMISNYPWMLPMTKREEWQVKTGSKVSAYGYPWLQHMTRCLGKDSFSMLNRKRVYDHALVICQDIQEHKWR